MLGAGIWYITNNNTVWLLTVFGLSLPILYSIQATLKVGRYYGLRMEQKTHRKNYKESTEALDLLLKGEPDVKQKTNIKKYNEPSEEIDLVMEGESE